MSLSEANPLSLDELLNRAILTMEDEAFVQLVAFYRAEAERFAQSEARGEKPTRAKITKAELKTTSVGESLEDLL